MSDRGGSDHEGVGKDRVCTGTGESSKKCNKTHKKTEQTKVEEKPPQQRNSRLHQD